MRNYRSANPQRQIISKYLTACTWQYDVIMINVDALQMLPEAECTVFDNKTMNRGLWTNIK